MESRRPSALAVFILIASSNLVGCKTGNPPGLVPLRTLPTYIPHLAVLLRSVTHKPTPSDEIAGLIHDRERIAFRR